MTSLDRKSSGACVTIEAQALTYGLGVDVGSYSFFSRVFFFFCYLFPLFIGFGASMGPGYVKADSRNLPEVNHVMIAEFLSKSDLYLSAEIRAVKNQRWVTVNVT